MKSLLQYTVLILFFGSLDAVKFRCDYRYTSVGWFKYHEIPAKWSDARLQCQLEGGMLASPTTATIKSLMLESFCKPEIFTGIHSFFSKGQFTSIDGIPLNENPHEWAPLEPDNKNDNESCISLNTDGKLSDVSCDELLPYICYRENSNIDVTACGTPDPEYHFNSKTNKCYKFHTTARTFDRAYFACSAEGGHLAIINSEAEAIFLRQMFDKYPAAKFYGGVNRNFAFIGFHNWGEKRSIDFRTIHGQTLQEAGFATFAGGQPDNAGPGEDCGSIHRNGLLNDLTCEVVATFICEKRVDHPAVCDTHSGHNFSRPDCTLDVQARQSRIDAGISGPVF